MKKSGTRMAKSLCVLAFAAMAGGCAGMGARLSPEAMGAHMTILALNMANNRAEIAEGQLALTNAAAPAVREFAQEMVTEHTANMQQQQALMDQMGITADMLAALPVTRQMEANHQAAMQALGPVRGAAFDRAYMERQAAMHRYALEQLDALMRNASGEVEVTGGTPVAMEPPRLNPGPAMALEQQSRAMIAEHEQHAQQVRTTLGGAM
ncbi:MAG: DUF4142 domain-containing protein [Gemmatimonadota bacterium]